MICWLEIRQGDVFRSHVITHRTRYIIVRGLSQIDTTLEFCFQFPKARGYVETLLPGYSRDGLTALVVFSFGPTVHGAVGYYLLRKVEGRRVIIERSIGYFS